ncbi:MAG: uroporphyrinogen-III synthase [Chloroflexota bacterium]
MNARHDLPAEKHLIGRTVLLTRAPPDNEDLRRALESLGAAVLALPTIAIAAPTDWAPVDRALVNLATYDWVVFASRHAVRAVCERLDALHISPALLPALAAVGSSTALELRRLGLSVDCVPSVATGAALVEALAAAGVRGKRILAPRGDQSGRELRDGLGRAGAVVEEVVVYRNVRPDVMDSEIVSRLEEGQVDVVVLGSLSALKNLIEILPSGKRALAGVRLACVGPTTAASARARGFSNVWVSEEPSLQGLVDTVVASCGAET